MANIEKRDDRTQGEGREECPKTGPGTCTSRPPWQLQGTPHKNGIHGSPGVGDGTHGEVLGGGGDYISLGPWGSPIGNLLLPLSCRLFLGHALARGLGSVQILCGLTEPHGRCCSNIAE